nr:anoctamin-3-like [Onthophagus taurus]
MFIDDMERIRIEDICNDTLDLCPPCVNAACLPQKIYKFCKEAMITYLTDNDLSILFAFIIVIWASIFLELWQRIEYTLRYRWNLLNVKPDIDERPEFKERTKNYVRINQYTGLSETYYPIKYQLRQYAISAVFCLICIAFFIATVMCIRATVYFFRYSVYLSEWEFVREYGDFAVKMYSGMATVIFIKLYTPVVTKISLFLTDKEVHRTRNSYLNSFILKSFVMSFFNTYTTLFYYAFLKNLRYTHPGDHLSYDSTFGIAADVCPPALGCTASLSIHILFLMLKNYVVMLIKKSGIVPLLYNYYKRVKNIRALKKKEQDWSKQHLPQWEVDYELIKPCQMFFLESFTSSVLEFGAVTLFVASLPLLPLLALINNIINLRLSSMTLTRRIRRSIPSRVNGLGAWNTVLLVLTRISFVISGCIIAFTTIFVHRVTYIIEKGNYTGFVFNTLSAFLIDDFNTQMRSNIIKHYPNLTACYYPGLRKHYNETRKYELSDRYYQILSFELLCLVIFVHFGFFCTNLLTILIPKEPELIRESIQFEEQKWKMENINKTEEFLENYSVNSF